MSGNVKVHISKEMEPMPEFWQKHPVLMTWISAILAIVAVSALFSWLGVRDAQLPINKAYEACISTKYSMTSAQYYKEKHEYPYCSTETIQVEGATYQKVQGGWQRVR